MRALALGLGAAFVALALSCAKADESTTFPAQPIDTSPEAGWSGTAAQAVVAGGLMAFLVIVLNYAGFRWVHRK